MAENARASSAPASAGDRAPTDLEEFRPRLQHPVTAASSFPSLLIGSTQLPITFGSRNKVRLLDVGNPQQIGHGHWAVTRAIG